MNILLTIRSFHFGGAENHVCDLANTLTENGHCVYIVAGKGQQVNKLNKEVRFIPLRFIDFLLPLLLLILIYHLKSKKIDIIHAHQRLPIFISCIVGKIMKIPVISTVHGRPRYDLRSKMSRKYSNGIIFVSDHVMKVYRHFEEIEHKSIVIPNGVKVPNVNSNTIPYRLLYLSRTDKKHAEVVNMLVSCVIPDLVKVFPDVSLQIIGTVDYPLKLKERVNSLNKEFDRDVCSILGRQENLDINLIQSSLVLGVGRVALEALCLGVPVLSVNYNHLGELVTLKNFEKLITTNFVDVHLPKPESSKFIELIEVYFINQPDYQDQTKKIQKVVLLDYNINKIVTDTEYFYSSVISKN